MNIINILGILVPLMLGWAVLSAFYWYAARPVLINLPRFRLFEKRDALRAMAISGNIDPNSFVFSFLEERLCRSIQSFQNVTLQGFLRFCVSDKSKDNSSSEMIRFENEASPELKKIWRDAVKDVMAYMAINSPLLTFLGFVLVLVQSLRSFILDKTCLLLEQSPEDCSFAPA